MTVLGMAAWFGAAVSLWLGARRYDSALARGYQDESHSACFQVLEAQVPETAPVYRLFNAMQGGAPSHRYTTKLAIVAQMHAQGWVSEGYGDNGVFMCSPL